MADTEKKILEVLFKYGLDKDSANAILKVNDEIKKGYEKVNNTKDADERRRIETKTLELELLKAKAIEAQSANLREQAILLRRQAKVMQDQAQDIADIAKPFILLGGGLIAGVIGLATKYVNTTEEVNATTEKWHQTQLSIQKSQERVGEVAARTLLPYYEKIAVVAEKVAGFIERNPQVIEGALKVGAVLLAVGTIGMAVSKGIKFLGGEKIEEAAVKMLLAAQLMNGAADKELKAAGLKTAGGASGAVGLVGKGLAAGGLTTAGTVVGLIALSATLTLGLSYALAKLIEKLTGIQLPIVKFVEYIAKFKDKLLGQAEEIATVATSPELSVANSQAKDQIVKAYIGMRNEELRITQETAKRKLEIIESYADKEADAIAKNQAAIASINSRASSQLSQLTQGFRNSEKQALKDYQNERLDIVKDGNKEIIDIEEQAQKDIARMAEDHNDRMANLVADRDALAIVLEKRNFNKEQRRREEDAEDEIRQHRADLAQRLQDLAANYQREREQRLADFQQRSAEIGAERTEALKQQAIAHAAEMKQLKDAKAKELKELDDSKRQQLLHAREAFIAQVRDLDAALLGERNIKMRYYNQMLSEAEQFMQNYRSALSLGVASGLGSASGGTAGGSNSQNPNPNFFGLFGTYDTGGYIRNKGIYRMAWDGQKEFVMSSPTTKLAEQMLGRELTQQSLLSMLAGQTGGQNVTYNDYGRYDSMPPVQDRRKRNKEIRQTLLEVVRK